MNKNGLQPYYGVLTGDLVNSSGLSDNRRFQLYREIQYLSGILKEVFSNEITYNLASFRGDGWQLVVNQPQKSLIVSIFLRTYFRYKFMPERVDTRVAISIGPVDYIPKENISAGYGLAFSGSGLLLDQMKPEKLKIVLIGVENNPYQDMLISLVRTIDDQISSWTAPQCQAINLALQNNTQIEIGEKWKPKSIAQPTVAKHLKSAQWSFIKNGIKLFEEIILRVIAEGKNY